VELYCKTPATQISRADVAIAVMSFVGTRCSLVRESIRVSPSGIFLSCLNFVDIEILLQKCQVEELYMYEIVLV